MCPECAVKGEVSDCDAQIQNKPCDKEDPVCIMGSGYRGGPQKLTQRVCVSREFYLRFKESCESQENCAVAMCDTSGCMAEFSSGMLSYTLFSHFVII